MAKPRKARRVFVCGDCGAEHPKWQGQCNECQAWNTLSALSLGASPGAGAASDSSPAFTGFAGELAAPRRLHEVSAEEAPRIATGSGELDRVLGGGLVPGGSVLVSGAPGAGKSTLLTQVLCRLAGKRKCLYVTGEESLGQVALRARRLQLPDDQLLVMSETSVEALASVWLAERPELLVVDSIQVMHTERLDASPGGVAQVRESAAALIRLAKETGTALFLVGHVTKEGMLAGPRVLEHMIDAFIMLEGDADGRYRTLRSGKNRFGAVNELGVFAMTGKGMQEVANPSAIFLTRGEEAAAGSAVMVVWEGSRPLLVEAQALVDSCAFGNPRRVAVGFEGNRLSMLLAVLHRHGGLSLGDQDVFVNAVGGIRVAETASDLPLLLAVVSSLSGKPLPRQLVAFGELGLSGEIRPVRSGQERLREAAKHGFNLALAPAANKPKQPIPGMKVIAAARLSEALAALESL